VQDPDVKGGSDPGTHLHQSDMQDPDPHHLDADPHLLVRFTIFFIRAACAKLKATGDLGRRSKCFLPLPTPQKRPNLPLFAGNIANTVYSAALPAIPAPRNQSIQVKNKPVFCLEFLCF
jgi:hypothetical protein